MPNIHSMERVKLDDLIKFYHYEINYYLLSANLIDISNSKVQGEGKFVFTEYIFCWNIDSGSILGAREIFRVIDVTEGKWSCYG